MADFTRVPASSAKWLAIRPEAVLVHRCLALVRSRWLRRWRPREVLLFFQDSGFFLCTSKKLGLPERLAAAGAEPPTVERRGDTVVIRADHTVALRPLPAAEEAEAPAFLPDDGWCARARFAEAGKSTCASSFATSRAPRAPCAASCAAGIDRLVEQLAANGGLSFGPSASVLQSVADDPLPAAGHTPESEVTVATAASLVVSPRVAEEARPRSPSRAAMKRMAEPGRTPRARSMDEAAHRAHHRPARRAHGQSTVGVAKP